MTHMELIKMAEAEGILAAVIPTADIPVNDAFRKFCEDNLCGRYNASYACPPGCGTVEEVKQQLLAADKALVLEKIYEIGSYENIPAVMESEKDLNAVALDLAEKLRADGFRCFYLGYGGCPLCNPCKHGEGKPCAFPDRKVSCLSAYCVDVAELAKRCGLEFAWSQEKLHMFGMIVLAKNS